MDRCLSAGYIDSHIHVSRDRRLIPMAVVLEPVSEQYALLACVILGGLTVSKHGYRIFWCDPQPSHHRKERS